MSEEQELKEYRNFLNTLSLYVSTGQEKKVGELLGRVQLLGWAWSNGSGDPEQDKIIVNKMINNLNKEIK